jgi:hypothetical protein
MFCAFFVTREALMSALVTETILSLLSLRPRIALARRELYIDSGTLSVICKIGQNEDTDQ